MTQHDNNRDNCVRGTVRQRKDKIKTYGRAKKSPGLVVKEGDSRGSGCKFKSIGQMDYFLINSKWYCSVVLKVLKLKKLMAIFQRIDRTRGERVLSFYHPKKKCANG